MINWIDILLLVIVVGSVYIGWRRGFILEAVDLIAWVAGILISFRFYPYVSVALSKMFPAVGVWVNIIAFLLTFFMVRLVFSFIIGLIMVEIPYSVQTNIVNKILGIVPGFINGVLTATIVALLLMTIPFHDGFSTQAGNSRVAHELITPAVWVENKISPVVDSAIGRTVAALTVEPSSPKGVRLPFTDSILTDKPGLEAEMLVMVNDDRSKAGLPPLQEDSALTAVARAHSMDMFQRGYFAHISPEGKSPAERLEEADIPYTIAGENLALSPTVSIANTGLMHSPGHRANILNPSFNHVGIGIIQGGIHGLMISQEFKN